MRKTKTFILIICLIISAAFLFSCDIGDTDGEKPDGGSQDGGTADGGLIEAESEIFILVGEGMNTELANSVYSSVAKLTDKLPEFIDDTVEKKKQEIVLGPSEREISKTAYRRLDRKRENEDDAGFLIYSDGESVAVAYDEDRDGEEQRGLSWLLSAFGLGD